jgi:hypothetical protein
MCRPHREVKHRRAPKARSRAAGREARAAVRLAYDRAAGQNRDAGHPGACMDTIETHSKPDPHGVAACVADG